MSTPASPAKDVKKESAKSFAEQLEGRLPHYDDYFKKQVPEQLGFLLVIDQDNITQDPNEQIDQEVNTGTDDASREKIEKEQVKRMRVLNKKKATLLQAQRLMANLKDLGFQMEMNPDDNDATKYYVRLSVSEVQLMECAHQMPLEKRLKPMVIPTLDNSPVIQGGYWPYSLSRADAYNPDPANVYKNIWPTLACVLPESGQQSEANKFRERRKFFQKTPEEQQSTKAESGLFPAYGAVYGTLCPPERMPYIPRTDIQTRHHDYPGIFEKPDPRDTTPDSLFTDVERLTLMLWKIQTVGGIDVHIQPNGKGTMSLFLKEDEINDDDDDFLEAEQVPSCWAACVLSLDKGKRTVPKWSPVPIGFLHFDLFTPTHDPVRRKELLSSWSGAQWNVLVSPFSPASWKSLAQPIDEIKEYFGVKIALYFLFVGHLLTWIWAPALFGLGVTAKSADEAIKAKQALAYDSSVSPFYTAFIILWAIFFLEFWKRKQFHYSILWGTSDFETKATYRKEWLEEYEKIEGTDDPAEIDPVKIITHEARCCIKTPTYFNTGLACKLWAGGAIIITSICVVLIAVFGIIVWRAISTAAGDDVGVNAANAVSAVAIVILGMIYKEIAVVLTRWENHKTDIEHEDALIQKTFIFEFVNQYAALLYIAFGKPILNTRLAIALDKDLEPPCRLYPKAWGEPGSTSFAEKFPSSKHDPLGLNAMRQYVIQLLIPSGDYLTSYTAKSYRNPSYTLPPMQFPNWQNFTNPSDPSMNAVTEGITATNWGGLTLGRTIDEVCKTRVCNDIPDPYSTTGNWDVGNCASCMNDNCMYEVGSQLLMILLIKSIGMKVVGYVIPLITRWYGRYSAKKEGREQPWYEVEAELPYYSDVTDEYKEIALMFGYVILFAASFPLAPLICFITTLIELRTDAAKILNSRRPMPQKVADIGTWYNVFDILSQVAIISNIALICFVSREGPFMDMTDGDRWMWVVIMEHVIIVFVYFVKGMIPDIAAGTMQRICDINAKMEYLHRVIRYKQFFQVEDDIKSKKNNNGKIYLKKQNLSLDPSCQYGGDYFVDEGMCLTKSEMSALSLEQMILQEEQMEDRDDDDLFKKPSRDIAAELREAAEMKKETNMTNETLVKRFAKEGQRQTNTDRVQSLSAARTGLADERRSSTIPDADLPSPGMSTPLTTFNVTIGEN